MIGVSPAAAELYRVAQIKRQHFTFCFQQMNEFTKLYDFEKVVTSYIFCRVSHVLSTYGVQL